MSRHAAESFDILDALDKKRGIPARKAAETFVCTCGQVRSVVQSPGEEARHRMHYHSYCGYCKCEPCQCDGHGN